MDWQALTIHFSLEDSLTDSARLIRFYVRRPTGRGWCTFSVRPFTGEFIVPCRDGSLFYYPWESASSNAVLHRMFAEGVRIPSIRSLPVNRPTSQLPSRLLWDLVKQCSFGLSLFSLTTMALPVRRWRSPRPASGAMPGHTERT